MDISKIERKKIAHFQAIDGYKIFLWWLKHLKFKRICTASPSGNIFSNTNLHYFEKSKSTKKSIDINGLEIDESLTYFIGYFQFV